MIISNAAKLIEGKTRPVISPDASVNDACKTMLELDARALLVLDGEKLVGVLSERDVVRKCIAKDLDTTETGVVDIMTTEVKTIRAVDSIAMAIEIMQEGGFHRVPVVDGEKVLGLITSDDIPDEYRMLLERFREMRGS
jgi:CBS domain-containing protein